MSFYRSQNVLCRSKFFEPAQKFDCKNFCASTKFFEEALNAVKFLDWLKIFGPAQNILGPVKGQGIPVLEHLFLFWNVLFLFWNVLFLFWNVPSCFKTPFSCFQTSFPILERPILIQNTIKYVEKNVDIQKVRVWVKLSDEGF